MRPNLNSTPVSWIVFLIILFLLIFPYHLNAYENKDVHPYITQQAFMAWPGQYTHENFNEHEIYVFLGVGKRAEYWEIEDLLPERMINPLNCPDGWTDGQWIMEGAKEEDNYDPVLESCFLEYIMEGSLSISNFNHHFWECDYPGRYTGLWHLIPGNFFLNAYEYAQIYWNVHVEPKYLTYANANNPIDPLSEDAGKEAYYYLGRIAHLLGDMSVPAHVHDDAHFINKDNYEDYVGGNYSRWDFRDVNDLERLPDTSLLDKIENHDIGLKQLFWNLAQRAQYFPSDGVLGIYGNDDHSTGNENEIAGLTWFDNWPDNTNQWVNESPGNISDENCQNIGDYMMPLAIQYTAALYQYFWRRFHPAPILDVLTSSIKGEVKGTVKAPPDSGVEIDKYRVYYYMENDSTIQTKNLFDFDPVEFVFEVDGLVEGKRYYFEVVTIDKRGNESLASNSMSKVVYSGPVHASFTQDRTCISPDTSVHFDATASYDLEGSIVNYRWDFDDGTIVSGEDMQEIDHIFTEDGIQQVMLTVEGTSGDTDQVTHQVYVGQDGTTYFLGGTISSDMVFGNCYQTYIVIGNITIAKGAKLTIEPNVTVKFAAGGQLNVYGTLDVKGVTFTWADGVNPWNGIVFFNTAGNSRLEDCVIEHARGYQIVSSIRGIIYIDGSSPTITGCTIRDSAASKGIEIQNIASPTITDTTVSGMTNYGIYVDNESSPAVSGCTLADNQYGIYVQYSDNNPVFSGNTYSNNSEADLNVTGTISGAVSWGETGDSVYMLSNFTVAQGAILSIAPGRTIKFHSGGQLAVNGTLDAQGVTFTWADGENQWNGIRFLNPESSASRLDGCIIEHARGYQIVSSIRGIIYIDGSSPTITGCTIRDSAASKGIEIQNIASPTITDTTVSGMTNYGIYVDNESSPAVSGCTLADNQYGIYVQYSDNNPVFSGNTYSNNSEADLNVTGTISGAVSWGETGDSVYMLSNFTVAQGAILSIAPGRTIKFHSGGQLAVNGTLDAQGVTFTWADGENQWNGIRFLNPESSASRLDGCIIEHARGYQIVSSIRGIIYIDGSSPTITGCTIRDSAASKGIEIQNIASPTITDTTVSGMTNYGIYVDNESSPAVSGCTLADNQYGIYVQYSDNNPVFSGNTYSNNSEADLNVTGTISGAVSWGETGDSVYMLSNFTVAQGAILSIAPGRTIKFHSGGQLAVNGTLDAQGVTFTWADGENQWNGIRFLNPESSASRLDGCIIEHARGYQIVSSIRGIIYIDGSSPTITGCTIRDSAASKGIEIQNIASPTITDTTVSGMTNYGIYVDNESSPAVSGCTLADNDYGVYIASYGNGVYQSNTIVGNTSYGIYKSGTTIVNAIYNYWGDITGPLDVLDDRNSGGWYNPDGLGDSVSNFVEYFPWIANPDDMDSDKMPDDWEWAIVDADPNDSIENPLDVLPFDDFDGDGFSNLREFLSFSSAVLIESIPLCWSDLLRDGDVDGADLSTFSVEIGKNDCSPTEPCSCDLDSNGLVDTIDLLFFAEDFARTDCY